ncbi:hypothetical protein PC9H_006481 [Pleurotus ostreatus]|uniref:MYND-type domain-containing protein n=1 Tax=Pleurotus ostreatus TaxID=5322 RepID=A0A8H7DRJ6_PLEOS|nr:uncharacterized protein PC9H_006481 [Pleurotus ostreatus]KAF7430770.1 hypothetical protein PC9H_006481 [Pleurotus ostreatus]
MDRWARYEVERRFPVPIALAAWMGDLALVLTLRSAQRAFPLYCSKECQVTDWKRHKADCNSPYLKSTWKPAWLVESRPPSFVGNEVQVQSLFGLQGVYLWGNVPTIDCLNIARNEQGAAKTMGFDLSFAASGDIRNMVQTVNGLPVDYAGKCSITLLADDTNPQEAAEAAIHLVYSSLLTREIADHLQHSLVNILNDDNAFGESTFDLGIQGNVVLRLPNRDGVMMAPSRIDHLHRHLFPLRPTHRLSFLRNRKTGILAPFGADVTHFTEPNKLMFSPAGVWLAADSADPLSGWDAASVSSAGKEHGLDPGDIYGSLYSSTSTKNS